MVSCSACLADHAQMRKLVEQLRADAGAFANQDQRVDFRQTAGELAQTANGVVENLDLVVGEHLETVELADGVLIIVKDGNLHGVYGFATHHAGAERRACSGVPSCDLDHMMLIVNALPYKEPL
ncbi:hypothetical protein BCAR13_60239 [Paraburkholderia caribensis]|nr:hypothetical protein BCAR13_60239 [Paraburkholderia caribensis]